MQTQEYAVTFIRPNEWSLITGMTVFQCYRELKRGNLRGVKIGPNWFIERDELENYWERARKAA